MTQLTQDRTGLVEVADGLYAYQQPDGGWCLNNSGVIVGGDRAILIDTAATEARAARLRDAVISVAGRRPHVVVNTHHHGDHVFGNALFLPEATLVAHERTRAETIESGYGLRMLFPQVEWGDVPLKAPDLTFTDAITLHAGDLRAELFHVGIAAHTSNDVVAWVPDRRVLFAGDIVMAGVTPYCLMGSISGSLTAIERLRALDPEVIVTGHGPVSGPAVLDETAHYLRWLTEVAAAGKQAGLTALQTCREADLGEFAELIDSERIVGNMHRAYAELDGAAPGAPINLLAGFTEMAEYSGGPPTCHA